MEGLKFEYGGTTYNVPCMPNKYWREALLYYGDCPARLVDCQDSMCYCCIYHRGNQKARKAFYYECFPEEKPVEAEKCCKECANYKPKEVPKLTVEVFNSPDCPEWAKWAAVDRNGKGYLYRYRPILLEEGSSEWLCSANEDFGGYCLIGKSFDSSDWEHSLIERPVKKRPKLTQKVFEREDCPAWAKWATVDEDGECFVWSSIPVLGYAMWTCPGYIKGDRQHIPAKRKADAAREDTLWDASNWRNSIIFRPNLPRYIVVRNKDFDLFRRNVQQMVEEGWKLEGGAVKDGEHYMQTLIKED